MFSAKTDTTIPGKLSDLAQWQALQVSVFRLYCNWFVSDFTLLSAVGFYISLLPPISIKLPWIFAKELSHFLPTRGDPGHNPHGPPWPRRGHLGPDRRVLHLGRRPLQCGLHWCGPTGLYIPGVGKDQHLSYYAVSSLFRVGVILLCSLSLPRL